MTLSDATKALEVWTLQNLLNLSILLGIVTLGMALIQSYYRSLRGLLTLRVGVEVWDLATTLFTDILLVVVVVIGYLVLNPDIMADIKMAIPFVPIATILFAIALVLRLFHGGHKVGDSSYMSAVWLMFAANLLNVIGFTVVMEAPSGEYLAGHPSPFWTFIKTRLRSNANLELSQIVFLVCFPILIAVLVWGFASGIKQVRRPEETRRRAGVA